MSHSIYHHDRYAKKLGGDSNDVSVLRTAEFPGPFDIRHDTDAHFWPYLSYVNGEPSEIQISVAVESRKPRGLAPNEAVLMHYLVVEYDAPGHESFDAVQRTAFLERLGSVGEDSVLLRYAVFYWTRAGARLIYRLREPISYERYEGKVRGLLRLFDDVAGIRMDPTSTQWWRCYRLPQVVREDGKGNGATWEQEYYELQITDEVIDSEEIQSVSMALAWEGSTSTPMANGSVPEMDAVLIMVEEGSQAYAKARKALRRTILWDYLYGESRLEVGHRDSMLVKLTGLAVSKLFGKELTAQHVYGLLLPLIDGFEADGSESWNKKLWRLVTHAWNAEVTKTEATHQEALEASDRTRQLAEQVASYYPSESLPDAEDELQQWALQRLVLVFANSCYPFTNNGYYSPSPMRTAQVAAHFREHFPWLGIVFRNDGSVRSGQDLVNECGINLGEMRYVARHKRGTILRQIDDRLLLEVSPYQIRQEILDAAAYDEEIAEWWRATGHYEVIREWLENAVAVDEGGIAGLSLKGPKGCGKTLLALGLAEVWGGSPVSGTEVFSRFNGGLLRTPVVLCDEGLPKKHDGMSVPDMYRTMVVGSDYPIESKFGAIMMSAIPLRFIFTANNPDNIKTLAGGKILTRDDTEALAQRLIHLEFSVEATAHFAARGGLAHTRHSSKGSWIGGDPAKGGCRLARMIAWCYVESRKNGRGFRGGRLLMEGRIDTRMAALLEGGGAAPDVVYVVCQDIERMCGTMMEPMLRKVMLLRDEPDGTKTVWIRRADYVRRLAERVSNIKNSEIRRILDRWMSEAKTANGFSMLRTEELVTIATQEDIDCSALVRISTSDHARTL